jgi:metal-responsive CopG/Arc/MetJ family transcriptional regulator
MTMKTISVKLPDALRVRLEAEAARRGVSLGAVVREAAETYVVKSPAQKKLSLYERSKDLCGCIRTAACPISPPNPKHLEGIRP